MTVPRFLIDENLSPNLVKIAHQNGFDATHVNFLGLAGAKDWELMEVLQEDGSTLVTRDGIDKTSGEIGLYFKMHGRPRSEERVGNWKTRRAA